MANLAKLDFVALDITGKNYLTLVVDTKIHLEAGNLEETIREENSAFSQDRAKTMIFIRNHLDEGLKSDNNIENEAFNEYNQLIYMLLVAEQNNELLMKNHQSRPTRSSPFPEVNAASLEVNATSSSGNNHKRGRGHKGGWWNGKCKNHGVQFHNQVPMHNSGPNFKNVNRHNGKAYMNNAPRNFEGAYHRCDGNGH
ncbi:uncharacterized protein [Pyrus communis]|uniref:uncharacterized protein n=1 Tax=Pyrus communis TaxID=23211 RepID=UPI0035BF8024